MIAAFSHSALQTFRQCPRKFKFQYIEKPDIPKTVSAEAYLGNAVHRVLQILYQRGADGVEIPLDTALDLYAKEWGKVDRNLLAVVTDFMAVDDYIRIGHDMLAKHYERYRPFKHGTLLGTELYLSFTLPGTPYKLRGIIDRLWKRDDGTVEICDYKTGKHLARPTDPDFFYQMGLYRLAVLENYPQYREIEVAQYYLRMNEVVTHKFHPDDIEKLVEDIRQAVLAVHNADRLQHFPTAESSLCNWCEYSHLCPAKRHQVMIDEGEDDPKASHRQAYQTASEYIEKYAAVKRLQAEMEALKEDMARLASELKVTKLAAKGGEVTLSFKKEEKFVTKTDNANEFAELSFVARELGLEDYFKLDGAALMKEAYAKGLLPKNIVERLAKYIRCKESVMVRVKLAKEEDEGEA